MKAGAVIVQAEFKSDLLRDAELLYFALVASGDRSDCRYYEGELVIDRLADELFSALKFDLSDYCKRVSGTAYIMSVAVGEGTTVEFIAEDIEWE